MAMVRSLFGLVILSLFSRGGVLAENGDGSSNQAGSDYMRREHSLVKPYTGSETLWDFAGSTVVTGEHVRLTADRQSQQGQLWNHVPCNMRHWEVRVTFQVHGHGDDLFGDGFAFWYTKHRLEFGPVFGSRNHFMGLGVFFDTYSNAYDQHDHQHPYISAMVSNGTFSYNHDEDGTHGALTGCAGVPFRDSDYVSHVSITYYMDTLSLHTRHGEEPDWVKCFEIRGVQLPTGYYFGFSAATGDLTDNHDILAVKTFELFPQETDKTSEEESDRANIMPFAERTEKPSDAAVASTPKSGGSSILFYLFIVIVLIFVGGLLAYLYQQNAQRGRSKTFF